MKIVFSRKGFDSQYGGVPNAVLPGGVMVPFPIQDTRSIVTGDAIRRGGEVVGEMVEQLTRGRIPRDYTAHLDPDLDSAAYPREPGWRPVLGQTDASTRPPREARSRYGGPLPLLWLVPPGREEAVRVGLRTGDASRSRHLGLAPRRRLLRSHGSAARRPPLARLPSASAEVRTEAARPLYGE